MSIAGRGPTLGGAASSGVLLDGGRMASETGQTVAIGAEVMQGYDYAGWDAGTSSHWDGNERVIDVAGLFLVVASGSVAYYPLTQTGWLAFEVRQNGVVVGSRPYDALNFNTQANFDQYPVVALPVACEVGDRLSAWYVDQSTDSLDAVIDSAYLGVFRIAPTTVRQRLYALWWPDFRGASTPFDFSEGNGRQLDAGSLIRVEWYAYLINLPDLGQLGASYSYELRLNDEVIDSASAATSYDTAVNSSSYVHRAVTLDRAVTLSDRLTIWITAGDLSNVQHGAGGATQGYVYATVI